MKVLIADDHWIVRETLKQVMRQFSQKFEPLEASDFKEAREILGAHPNVGLMLIDLIMPGFNEFDGLKALREQYPDVPVVVVSVHEDPDYVLKSIAHGVVGYIPKSAQAEEIMQALERVLSGEVSFPRKIITGSHGTPPPSRSARTTSGDAAFDKITLLSEREREVLKMLGRGLSVAATGKELGISPQTVRVHLNNTMKKLQIRDRSEAIHFAITYFGEAG
ncbi:MAG: response regulator transcription factor [Alphaproteobacteria bacterium]